MKRIVLFALIALLAVVGPVSAQTLTQQSPTMLNACNVAQNITGAVNTTATMTITPPAGQFVYLCGIDWQFCQDATGNAVQSAAGTRITTTGMPAGFPTWQFGGILVVDGCWSNAAYFANPVKSANAGAAVTIVEPGIQAHWAYNTNAYYYFAP